MKNIVTICLALLTGISVAGASTCETRVDKNLDKTTAEKVRYCLTEETETTAAKPTAQVITTDVYDIHPKKKTPPSEENQTQITKDYQAGVVTVQYIDRPDYPVFRNKTLPHINTIEANETALEAIQAQKISYKQTKPAKKKATKKSTKSKTKPARKTDTPAAEIQEANALQNDPLTQDTTDNGTVPAGFLDDSVMGPSDFGNNATDPAFQQ